MDILTRALTAIAFGSVGVVVILGGILWSVERFGGRRLRRVARPWVFLGPLGLIIGVLVVLPTIRTVYLSFMDRAGREFVGVENLIWAFTSDTALIALRNNVLWVVVVTGLTVVIGMLVAIISERVRFPRLFRSIVFMPMAISAVGASVIWKLVYTYRPETSEQIGLFNQILVWLGSEPMAVFTQAPWNNFFLMWIMVWVWTGFPTVVFAAALRTVPSELVEAAALDGASQPTIYFSVVFPYIRSTISVVIIATVVTVLKVFDIIRVSTNGLYDTNVIANEMIQQSFRLLDSGRGSALALVLFLIIAPLMWLNAREMKAQR